MLSAFLFLNFFAFAQQTPPPPPPGVTANGGPGSGACPTCPDLEGDDLPINEQLIWLAVCGIIFAYYTYNKTYKNKISE